MQALSSGRSAILAYTMPVFSALWGVAVFGDRIGAAPGRRAWPRRPWAWCSCCGSEVSSLGGAPLAPRWPCLRSACIWALGTHLLRRSDSPLPLLTLVFWMTALPAAVLVVLAWPFEREQWRVPLGAGGLGDRLQRRGASSASRMLPGSTWPRSMPPMASTISVMMIPVLGTFSGAWALGEVLHWPDFAAMALMVLAIGAVLWRR